MKKKVLLIVAGNGFQPVEYSGTKAVLEKAGFEVLTASDKPEKFKDTEFFAVASDNSKVKVDLFIDEIFIDDYAGIFLIGGPGAMEHLDNYLTYKIFQDLDILDDVIFGAICISPRIIANAGVLNGRKATGWDDDNKLAAIFDQVGALYIRTGVVVDRNLITANGPKAVNDFAQAIVDTINERLF